MDAIIVNNVTKRFRIYQEKNTTLKERLIYAGRTKYTEFLALDNVSLTISKGQTVGLIGTNGSGKSTLLKLMTRILYPNQGTIKVRGRVSSLLELGAGFHPDFSGRENIYMNASILGLTKKEIDRKLDDIIRFSELEKFIDHPVRSYSSGMYMRLAFSVAINVEPDVLLVDEVLAVGDASFQRKCINRIKELKGAGKTIVFVSHDQGVMETLCDTVYWLREGRIVDSGDPKRVIGAYLTYTAQKDDERQREERAAVEAATQLLTGEAAGEEQPQPETSEENRWGSGEVQILSARLTDAKGSERNLVQTGEESCIEIEYAMQHRPQSIRFHLEFQTADGVLCYATNTGVAGVDLSQIPSRGRILFRMEELSLLPGHYDLDASVQGQDGVPYDYRRRCLQFEVCSGQAEKGIARIKHRWDVQPAEVTEENSEVQHTR